MKRFWILTLATAAMFLIAGTACNVLRTQLQPAGYDANTPLYTAYNLWFEKVDNVWSTNYKVGNVLPAGTKITNVQIGTKRRHEVLAFTVPSLGDVQFIIHYNQKHHGSLAFSTFKDRLITTKDFAQLTKGFSKKEIEAIKCSRPYISKGMSKKAAVVAFGYPPEGSTPSTNLNTWKYWINRWRTILVRFNDKGQAEAEVQPL